MPQARLKFWTATDLGKLVLDVHGLKLNPERPKTYPEFKVLA